MATESNTAKVAQAIDKAGQHQHFLSLLIQAYANSVNQQPNVDFSGDEKLKKYETGINDGLKKAQSHANSYLFEIPPAILKNIANIGNYYALHNAVAEALPEGSTEQQWIVALNALATESGRYQKTADSVVNKLNSLSNNLNVDTADFAKVVSNLNAAVDGDNGVLDSIGDQLDTIQSKIDRDIAGTVFSALAIGGGVCTICVGAITDFVTAGASTPVVVAGVVMVAAGIGGEVAAAITLKKFNDEKAALLTNKANLKAEVKLALGISKGYISLKNHVITAVSAAEDMAGAWTSLSADLKQVTSDLQSGVDVETVRKLFLTSAKQEIKKVLKDIDTIKRQMSGVVQIVAQKGQTVGEAAVAAAKEKEMGLNVESIKSSQSGAPSETLSQKMGSSKSFRTSAPSGNLSQSLANLNSSVSRVRAISNLPTAAVAIQEETLSGASEIISQMKSLQGSVGGYVTSALPQLNTIEAMLANKEPFDRIKAAVQSLQNETGSLNTHSHQALSAIRNTVTTTNGYFSQLSLVQTAITSQKTQLEAQLRNAVSQEEAAKKKYYWLIALGPLAFFGFAARFAAALAAYLAIKSEVNGYESQIDSLDSHISSLDSMSTATPDLSTNIGDVVSKVSSVNNAVTFVSNDVLSTIHDLKTGEALHLVEIFVKAAITEVNTLKVDAS